MSVHVSPLLHFEHVKLLNFDFNADPNPANADPDKDLASKVCADPCGSGTLVSDYVYYYLTALINVTPILF
jgi:hypothetical protein